MTRSVTHHSSQAENVFKKWLDVKAAAAHIGMSTGFIRKAVRAGVIPYCRVGTKALRFDREALDGWMAANSNGRDITNRKN